jgi:hypothetical protein
MERRGVNYDVGTFARRDEPSRATLDPVIMRREIEVIRNDLHCNAIRISGQEIGRLRLAAEYALRQGLEVWFSPAMVDADERQTLAYLTECAQAAEQLRQQSPKVVFVVGCELTFFMRGIVDGDTLVERMRTFMKPWRMMKSSLVRGPFNRRLNAFLARAAAVVRESFHGQLTYASGPWEKVDWTPFDFVGVDYYQDAANKASYRQRLRGYLTLGKPVVVLEFGCCTYQGAEEKGGYGWNIVDRDATPRRLRGTFVRDEEGQSRYLMELLDIFREEQVDGAFVFTFVMPSYPYSDEPSHDLDMASYSLVKTYQNQTGQTYEGMPWEPKESFRQIARYYLDKM